MIRHFLREASYGILCVVLCCCAGQAPPPGGPPDTTPPEIIESSPSPNSLHFSGRKIALKFSEYVDRSSVEQSVFFSPPVGTVSFDWGGSDVGISFTDSLRQNTTYIMMIGTDVVDRRNHNRMASAFALPFSTGEHIDSARIEGKVSGTPPDGVMIFAYKLDGIKADTLNPVHTKPFYLTQTGKDGSFRLPNMAFGLYRLIAVRDQFRNLLYDPQVDEFGVTNRDVFIDESHGAVRGVYFLMSKEDTSAPFVSSARAVDRIHVLLRLSEPVPLIVPENISILDTLKETSLDVLDVSFPPETPADVEVVTAPQESAATYRIAVSRVRDASGNSISAQSHGAVFGAAVGADTTKPGVSLVGIQDSARNVQRDDSLVVAFTEAVKRTPVESGWVLKGRGAKVDGKFTWTGSSSAVFLPASPLNFGTWYEAELKLDSVIDVAGNSYRDSTWHVHFHIVEEKSLGSLAGTVVDEQRSPGNIVVTLSDITSRTARRRTAVADSMGKFRFAELPEGRYTVFAFRDADGNGTYSYGRPFPYETAEKFSPAGDTLKVRARWPLEGVVVKIP